MPGWTIVQTAVITVAPDNVSGFLPPTDTIAFTCSCMRSGSSNNAARAGSSILIYPAVGHLLLIPLHVLSSLYRPNAIRETSIIYRYS